jgi:hypothetical protein
MVAKVLRMNPVSGECAQDKLKAASLFPDVPRVYETSLWNRANVVTP